MPPARPALALLSALQASGFVGTWTTDLSSGTVYPSRRLAELLGLTAGCAAGGTSLAALLDRVHTADRERIGALVHEAHRTAGRFEAEFRTLTPEGLTKWVSARGQVEKDGQGHGVRCHGIAIDITDTRQRAGANAAAGGQVLYQIADQVVAIRQSADALESSLLRTLLDILLLELGRELARSSGTVPNVLH